MRASYPGRAELLHELIRAVSHHYTDGFAMISSGSQCVVRRSSDRSFGGQATLHSGHHGIMDTEGFVGDTAVHVLRRTGFPSSLCRVHARAVSRRSAYAQPEARSFTRPLGPMVSRRVFVNATFSRASWTNARRAVYRPLTFCQIRSALRTDLLCHVSSTYLV